MPSSPGPCRPTVVADVAGRHGKVVCAAETSLRDAAAQLLACDRTAAVVLDDLGRMVGAFTDTDVLHAYAGEAPGTGTLGSWLHDRRARLPGDLLPALTVGPATRLVDAAATMRAQAGGDFASRHLVVEDQAGAVQGILSALDVARAVCAHAAEPDIWTRIEGGTAENVMKPRSVLPQCHEMVSIAHALDKMMTCRQNCILVTDGDEHSGVRGVFTVRDALRAFAEGIPADVLVGHWMFCLDSRIGPRIVVADASIADAASQMARGSIHHLVVVQPDTAEVVGMLSSSDLAQAIGSPERVVGCSC